MCKEGCKHVHCLVCTLATHIYIYNVSREAGLSLLIAALQGLRLHNPRRRSNFLCPHCLANFDWSMCKLQSCYFHHMCIDFSVQPNEICGNKEVMFWTVENEIYSIVFFMHAEKIFWNIILKWSTSFFHFIFSWFWMFK